jgi:hypothetical protein
MKAYVQTCCVRPDGSKDSFLTTACDAKVSTLWWQDQGLSFTASGYGSRIPTRYMVRWYGKWRRVYCRIYSNVGACYIGKPSDSLIVSNIEE